MKALFSRFFSAARRFPTSGGIFFLAAALAIFWPHPAMAAASTFLGDVVCNVYNTFDPFAFVIAGIAYVAGGILVGSGLLQLKAHSDNPQNAPLNQAIARLVGGATLLGAPIVAETIVNTLFTVPGPGGAVVCTGGVTPSVATSLDVIINNLISNLAVPFELLVSGAAYVIGAFLIVRGLMKGAKYGTDPRTSSPTHILGSLTIGAILIAGAGELDTVMNSLFGGVTSTACDVSSWAIVQALDPGAPSSCFSVGSGFNSSPFVNAIAAGLTFCQMLGMLAFVRGWYIVKNAVEGAGQATMAQGFTHIIGGVLAVNIYAFLEIVDWTFGTGFLL